MNERVLLIDSSIVGAISCNMYKYRGLNESHNTISTSIYDNAKYLGVHPFKMYALHRKHGLVCYTVIKT